MRPRRSRSRRSASSRHLAQVRRGVTVIVCNRQTPIARLVPYAEAHDEFTVHEPTASTADLKRVTGIKVKRAVDVVRILGDSRDQR